MTGASGSGKSTLLNLLGGLDTPSAGTIEVGGALVSAMDREALARYRRFVAGMIFQSFNLVAARTALENVELPLIFAGVERKERRRRAAELLDKVGLAHRAAHRPPELSGGEQQRVAVARALANGPRLLLADEPTGNLDSRTSREIVGLLAGLNRESNLTVIMVSHEEALVREFAQRDRPAQGRPRSWRRRDRHEVRRRRRVRPGQPPQAAAADVPHRGRAS